MIEQTIKGRVKKFSGKGRQLGYPTANITTETDLKEGVYFGFADLANFKNKPSLIFIGVPTTVGDSQRRIEVHLLDIEDVNYYNQPLSVRIAYFHRPNKHFNSINELERAMNNDETVARKWFVDKS